MPKCAGIITKARRKFHRSSVITLAFAYPYFIYCNHVWGNNYASTLEEIKIIQKRLINTVLCSLHFHVKQFVNENLPDIFNGFFLRKWDRNVQQYNVRTASYAQLDIKKFSLKISGTKLRNVLRNCIKESSTLDIFKQNFIEAEWRI